MWRALGKIVFLSALVVAGSAGLYFYYDHYSVNQRLQRLEEKKRQLEVVVQRLSSEKRVAQVLVTEQKAIEGVQHTTLLFVEYGKDGRELPPKSFTIKGNSAHIDALVIKFERGFLEQNDALRGHSIVLFYRLFGDHQNPADGFPIDRPGRIPEFYQGVDPRVGEFEQGLWSAFWRLADDEGFRKEKGVRVANRESPWGPFEPDKLYTISLEAAGGLNITSEPVKAIYREAMKARAAR